MLLPLAASTVTRMANHIECSGLDHRWSWIIHHRFDAVTQSLFKDPGCLGAATPAPYSLPDARGREALDLFTCMPLPPVVCQHAICGIFCFTPLTS